MILPYNFYIEIQSSDELKRCAERLVEEGYRWIRDWWDYPPVYTYIYNSMPNRHELYLSTLIVTWKEPFVIIPAAEIESLFLLNQVEQTAQ